MAAVEPGTARSSGTISGTVTRVGGGALTGATVTLAGADQTPTTTATGSGGDFSFNPGGAGPYSVEVQASGFGAQSVSGLQPGDVQDFALEPVDTTLPVYAGQADGIAADPTTGIFYALASEAPDAYRSLDYGGTWHTMTPSYEDPDTGLETGSGGGNIVTSSVTGEVAVRAGEAVSFSTDYGLTWRTMGGDLPPPVGGIPIGSQLFFWGHAGPGAPNVLIFARRSQDGSWEVWRADMDAADPALVKEPSDPFGTGSAVAFADSQNGSFVGRVSSAGALSFAPLTASGPIAFGSAEATGLPSPPQLLRLGGGKEASAPPDGALVVGDSSPFVAQMLTKDAGSSSFDAGSLSAATDLPDGCNFHGFQAGAGPRGSVAPTTSGTSGAGSASSCWLQKSGTDPLSATSAVTEDIEYDSQWGQGQFVILGNGFGGGPIKYARLDSNGVPVFEGSSLAAPGTDPGSGGLAVNGITSAKVKDTVYGPAGAQELAVTLHVGSGQLSLASNDGGQTMTSVVKGGGDAVDWWQGTSGEWLLFGHFQFINGNMLSAFPDWNGETSASGPNVSGSTAADLGGETAHDYDVSALAGVPGTNKAFIGLASPSGEGGNHLYRVRLVPGNPPSLADVTSLDSSLGGATLYQPSAMAYCPDSPSTHPGMGDVLFVATSEDAPGSLLRITGATSGSPSGSVVESIPHDAPNTFVNDVRANCAAGVVYAGGGGATALYKSVNGGVDFSGISSAAEVGGAVAAIGLNPADPTAQDLEVSNGLNILHSSDGGGSWTVVHDPTVSRAATIHDIEYPPAGGAMAPEARGAALATPSLALVGTGAGAFEGDISATTGLMAASGNVTGTRIGNQITTVRSDSQPSLATAPASGRGDAVFRRSNGLYLTSARDGSWSLPSLIPGTRAGDEYPAVARAGGGLYLAFARTGVAPGIYVATRNFFGVWSLPKRVSTGSDTRPAIALTGSSEPKIHVAFLRTVGSARGVFHVTNVGGGWHTAKRIPGSTPADSDPALGGPVLQAGAENLRLAFARAGITPGIYYATTPIGSNPSWSELKRVTSVAGDVDPALAIDQTGVSHIVFRRSTGSGPRGLFALRGPPWSLQRVSATIPVDREPSLVEAGSSLILSFARPSTIAPGVYIDRETAAGDWLAKPRRWSSHATDRTPSVGAHTGGRATVLFQRR